jgi:hypothetical protein
MFGGIDWATGEHAVAVHSDDGAKRWRYAIPHSRDGFDRLVAWLARFALAGEAARAAQAAKGTRYHTLGGSSYRLGRLIAGGEVEHAEVWEALWAAVKAWGYLDDHGATTVRKEIESGLQAGACNPRTRRPRASGLAM